MRGLKPNERAMTETVIAEGTCVGAGAQPGRAYTPAEREAIDVLVSHGRLAMTVCGCGKKHVHLTAAGLEARRLDTLANTLPIT